MGDYCDIEGAAFRPPTSLIELWTDEEAGGEHGTKIQSRGI